jgi:hypothetical protein
MSQQWMRNHRVSDGTSSAGEGVAATIATLWRAAVRPKTSDDRIGADRRQAFEIVGNRAGVGFCNLSSACQINHD